MRWSMRVAGSAGKRVRAVTGAGNKLQGEVLLEMRRVGAQMRVAAIHAPTRTEIVFIAPLNATREQLSTLARAKLARRLQRQRDG